MIRAVFFVREETGDITRAVVSGHAGFDAYGYDIVCASVSALVISTINALEEYVGLESDLRVQGDTTSFSVVPIDEETRIQSQTLLYSLKMAIESMAQEYDDFISVNITEV